MQHPGWRIEPGWSTGQLVLDDRVGLAAGIELPAQPLGPAAVEPPYELGLGLDLRPPDARHELPAQLQVRFGLIGRPPDVPLPSFVGSVLRALVDRVGAGQPPVAAADPERRKRWGADMAASTIFQTGAYGMPMMEELHVMARQDVPAAILISKRALLMGSMSPDRFNGFQMAFNAALRWDPVGRQRPQPPVYADSYFCVPGPHLALRPERVAELDAMRAFLDGNLPPAQRPALEQHLRAMLAGGDAPDDPFLPMYRDMFVSAFANAAVARPLIDFYTQQLGSLRVMRDFKGLCLYWLHALPR